MLEVEWEAAARLFAAFLDKVPPIARAVGLYDVDADGIAAGVVWQRMLERLGFQPQGVLPDRDRNAWTPANRAKVEALCPEALWVLDLGSQCQSVVPAVPTCFIDHHHPEGVPPGATLISAYTWDPVPNTSWMMWEIGQSMAPLDDLDWIAVLGTLSDLGEKAPWDQIVLAKKRYGAKWLKEATVLVNAARRASLFQPETAARALLQHESPRSFVESTSPEVQALRTARLEVAAALQEAKKAAPLFAGNTALLRVCTPCQVHPLIAQIWRSRLAAKYLVICANEGYLPGTVNFSARGPGGSAVFAQLYSPRCRRQLRPRPRRRLRWQLAHPLVERTVGEDGIRTRSEK